MNQEQEQDIVQEIEQKEDVTYQSYLKGQKFGGLIWSYFDIITPMVSIPIINPFLVQYFVTLGVLNHSFCLSCGKFKTFFFLTTTASSLMGGLISYSKVHEKIQNGGLENYGLHYNAYDVAESICLGISTPIWASVLGLRLLNKAIGKVVDPMVDYVGTNIWVQ